MTTLGPLGLLEASRYPTEQINKLQYIEGFDLERNKVAAIHQQKIEELYSDLIERELKRFLSLALFFPSSDHPFVPSFQVDMLWHFFIIDTARYRQFCDHVCGNYIDHEPEDTRAKAIAKYAGEVFGHTKRCLTELYGGLPPSVWGLAANCDRPAPCLNTSDARLKTNIQDLDHVLDKLRHLRGVRFEWSDQRSGDRRAIGVLAQEVQAVFPELVGDMEVGDITRLGVDYNGLVGVLVEAVKELQDQQSELRQLIGKSCS